MTAAAIPEPTLSQPEAPLKKKRVLLVDACMATRDLRAETMRKLGMEVDCAADIIEARSWWRADLYNLVLFSGENEPGHRDKFCDDLRSATPPQQIAFFVGKPGYLANLPNAEGAIPIGSLPEGGNGTGDADTSTALAEAAEALPQRWGILEASRRISAVRSLSHARSKAIQERPAPPRDSEIRLSRRAAESRSLDQLLREEVQ
jgi:hypothetical protein